MQRTRKFKPSSIFWTIALGLFLVFAVAGMMAGGADRPEPLASVQLDEDVDERTESRDAAGSALEQGAHDIQDGALDAVDKGAEAVENFDYEGLKEDSANAWGKITEGFTENENNFGFDVDSGNESSGGSYERAAFGEGWATGSNGCSVRDNILQRDLDNVVKDGCVVASGTLNGGYSGNTTQHERGSNGSASEVHIDHIVPLSYAWEHGASDWSDSQREAFANDALNLKAVGASANTSKSDSGPSDWMPSVNQCEYAETFNNIANNYDLNIPEADAATVGQYC